MNDQRVREIVREELAAAKEREAAGEATADDICKKIVDRIRSNLFI